MLNRWNKDIVKEEVLHPLGIGRKRSLLVFAWVFALFLIRISTRTIYPSRCQSLILKSKIKINPPPTASKVASAPSQ